MFSWLEFSYSYQVYPKGLRSLFIASLLRTVGYGFDFFFMPYFLYQLGLQLNLFPVSNVQNGMLFLGVFFLLERCATALCSIPVSRLIQLLGVRNSLIASQVLYICVLLIYIFVQKTPLLLFLVILIQGVRLPLYWSPYLSVFSSRAVTKKIGESIGTSLFFIRLFQAAIPALVGLLIVEFGFSYAFFTSVFFQALSVLVLFFVQENLQFSQPSGREFQLWLKDPSFRFASVSAAAKYMADTLQAIWPLFVLLLIGTPEKVGYLFFIVLFISLLITYFSGWYLNHSRVRKTVTISGLLLGLLWFVKSFLIGAWTIITIGIFHHLTTSLFTPSHELSIFKKSSEKSLLSYFVYREMILSIAGIIFWLLFILYFSFSSSWRGFILVGFVAALLSMYMTLKSTTEVVEEV